MNEVLIAHLRECAKLDPSENTYAQAADALEELITKLNHADEQIEKLVEAAEERCWIPVTERLPEDEDALYLICEKRAFGNGFFYEVVRYAKDLHKVDKYDFAPEDVNGFYRYDGEWGGYYKLLFVNYWMPIPTPPKGEEE